MSYAKQLITIFTLFTLFTLTANAQSFTPPDNSGCPPSTQAGGSR